MNLAILWDAADGDAVFARELADTFLQQVAAELARLRAAVSAQAGDRVRDIAHFCKGSSHTCGATALAALFGELSRLGAAGQLDGARRLLSVIEHEFAGVQAALAALPAPPGVPRMKKILIIDDDPLVTRVYARHFRADGFDVRVANSGAEGLAAVSRFLPDAVLLDLNMPDFNGIQWLEAIRRDARFARLPVTVFTAGEIGWQVWAANNAEVAFIFKEGAVPRNVVQAINAALAAAPADPGGAAAGARAAPPPGATSERS